MITDNGSHLLMQGDVWSIVVDHRGVDRRGRRAGRGRPAAGSSVRPPGVQRLLCVPAALLLLYLQPPSPSASALAFLAVAVVREPDHPRAGSPHTRGGTIMIRPISRLAARSVAGGRAPPCSSLAGAAAGGSSRPPRRTTAAAVDAARPAAGSISIATGNATGVYYVARRRPRRA